MKTKNNYFLTLVDLAMRTPGRLHMRPVIEKELLHYDILFALDNSNLLDKLTFQGGTSLRLCYGALRFSEDLDFAGGIQFNIKDLMSMKICLEDYLTTRYSLEINVREPKDLLQESEHKNMTVNKWQLRVMTHPERKDMPKKMSRFLPEDVQQKTLLSEKFLHLLLRETKETLQACEHQL